MATGTTKLSKKAPNFTSYITSSGSSSSLGEHGVANPLHWDNLSDEVRKQLETNKLSYSGEKAGMPLPQDSHEIPEKKKRHLSQPEGTFSYTIGTNDTLASIAAHFDTTPSFLKNLNHLISTLIFPDQTIYIPDKDYKPPQPSPVNSPVEEKQTELTKKDSTDSNPLSPKSPKNKHPGHAERLPSASDDKEPDVSSPKEIIPPKPLSEEEAQKLDQECYERFIKVDVKYITDGMGVVSGVLLVTPNAVMFDPNVMDVLVTEHGADAYGMIAPMEMIISAALYHDIAAMKVKGAKNDEDKGIQKSSVYKGEDLHQPHVEQQQVDDNSENTTCHENPQQLLKSNSSQEILINFESKEEDLTRDNSESSLPESNKQTDTASVSNSQESKENANATEQITGISNSTAECDKYDVKFTLGNLQKKCHNVETVAPVSQNANEINDTTRHETGVAIQTDAPVVLDIEATGCNENALGTLATESTVDSITALNTVDQLGLTESHSPPLFPHMQIGSITYFQYDEKNEQTKVTNNENTDLSGESEQHIDACDKKTEIKKTASSSSWVNLPHVPSLKNFVDFSSGLFSNKQEDREKVNDIHDANLKRVPSTTWYTDDSTTSSDSMTEKSKATKRSQKKRKARVKTPVEVESVVKPDDMPALFQTSEDLIPKPSVQYEDPPLYLCLKIGMPVNKRVSKTCPIESYNKKKKKPEYWFSIPRDKVDHLYAFFVQWSPNIYGTEDDIDPKARGFIVLESDDEDSVLEDPFCSNKERKLSKQISKDWEIVNVDEARRRLSLLEVEESLPLPELLTPSIILEEYHIKKLTENMPARAEGYPWTLIYSTEQNGFSLKTLYRNMHDCDTPVLLVVKDTEDNVFGAMASHSLVFNDHFYGTGESFLFTFSDNDFRVYHWSGENQFFIRGSMQSLAFGAGRGRFGLWLDSDFYHGRTQACETFDSVPLTESEDFSIAAIEAWGFF